MTLGNVVLLTLRISIMLQVVALGLMATEKEAFYLFSRPRQLLRTMLAMNLVMPIVAAALAAGFHLNPAVKIALVGLAVSPVPPLFPRQAIRAAGESSYAVGLLVATSLFAVVFVPLAIDFLGNLFGRPVHVPVPAVVKVVSGAVLGPLAVGILLHRLLPIYSQRLARPVALVANVLLVAGLLVVLFTAGKSMWSLIGNGTVAALAVFIVVGLATGYLLGGPAENHRSVLALATALRHPGMALTIAAATFPQLKLVPAAILLYLIVGLLLIAPYLRWRRGKQSGSRQERLAA